jgi:hypothetical protein
MSLEEHFNTGNEVEEKGQAAQMDAALTPPGLPIEHRRKNGNGRRRIEARRNSKPKQVHFDSPTCCK